MTAYDIKMNDSIDGYGKVTRVTEKAILVEGHGWIPLSILHSCIVYIGKSGENKRFEFNAELPHWFLQANPNWKAKKNYGF